MAKVFKIDGNTLPDGAILMEGGKTSLPGGIGGLPVVAFYCEPGIGTINVDDPDGDYDLQGWHTFTVDETESIGTERQWSGWLIGRRVTRGPYRDGPGRVWEVEILEINGLFNLEVFRANSAQRPAETDVERIQWMIMSAAMAGTPIVDDGRLSTADPRNLSAGDFVRSFPTDMATNAAGQSGKNVYAYWSHADSEIAIHYDALGAGPDCTLRVSNVIADQDSTTFYPFVDAELDADAYSLYTGVLLDYVGGAVYGRNDALIDVLSPTEFSPINFLRDQSLRSDRISRLTTANTYLATYLAAAAEEKESIVLSIRVPAEDVGLIEAGMNIDVKLIHLVGLEDFTTLPIIRLSKVPTPDRTDTWDVRMELSRNAKVTLAPGGDPGVFPHEGCTPALVQEAEVVDTTTNIFGSGLAFTSAPGTGNLQLCWIIQRDHTDIAPTGWTAVGSWQVDAATGGGHKDMEARFFYRFTVAGDPALVAFDNPSGSETAYVHISEWVGLTTFDGLDTATDDTDQGTDPQVFGSNPISIPAGQPTLLVNGMFPSLNTNDAWHPACTTGGVDLGASGVGGISAGGPAAKSWLGYQAGPGGAGLTPLIFTVVSTPASGNARGWASMVVSFHGDCEDVPPGVATPIRNEFVANGDDTTTEFTTRFPYAPGSLRVFVDGVPIVNGLTETDPATGTFTLDFAPRDAIGDTRAEIVTADYQVGTP